MMERGGGKGPGSAQEKRRSWSERREARFAMGLGSFAAAVFLLLLAGASSVAAEEIPTRTVVVELFADAHLENGRPNENFGGLPVLALQSGSRSRILLAIDPAAVRAALGGQTLLGAHLEFFAKESGKNWGPKGQDLGLFRLSQPWAEEAVTWNCPADEDLTNHRPDCPEPWDGGTCLVTPTATHRHTRDFRGWISLDVTPDLQAFLAGTELHGWLLKQPAPPYNGTVSFGSREGAPDQAPRLVLSLPADVTPPELEIKAPKQGHSVHKVPLELVLEFSDEGSGVDRSSLRIDLDQEAAGQVLASCQLADHSATCELPDPGDLPHLLQVYLKDHAGNETSAFALYLGRESDPDTSPPSLTVSKPENQAVIASGRLWVEAFFEDGESGIAISQVQVTLDGEDIGPSCRISSDRFFCDREALDPGRFELVVRVADLSGNTTEARRAIEVAPDREPPTIQWILPEEDLLHNVDQIAIRAAFRDEAAGVDPSTMRFHWDGEDRTAQCSVSLGELFCPALSVTEGVHRAELFVADKLGNQAHAEKVVTILQDSTPPSLSLVEPSPNSVVSASSVRVKGLVSDSSGEVLVLFRSEEVATVDGSFEIEVALEATENFLNFLAIDEAGNVSSAAVRVLRDDVAPFLDVQAPSAGTSTNSSPIEIRGRVRDSFGISRVWIGDLEASVDPATGEFSAVVALIPGSQEIIVAAQDGVGNVVQKSVPVEYFPLPVPRISEPVPGSIQDEEQVIVVGAAPVGVEQVLIQGIAVPVVEGRFEAMVPLREGRNVLAVQSEVEGAIGQDISILWRDTVEPRVALDHPVDSASFCEASVPVSGSVLDLGGPPGAGPLRVFVNGHEAEVLQGRFLVEEVPLAPGENRLEVVAEDALGHRGRFEVSVHREPFCRGRLRKVGGDLQAATKGTVLSLPLEIEVVDASGLPVPGHSVAFRVDQGGGVLENGRRLLVTATDQAGRARATFRLGSRAGLGNQRVRVEAVGEAEEVLFLASALPGPAVRVVVEAGSEVRGPSGQLVAEPLIAVAVDDSLNRVPGAEILFEVIRGSGRFSSGERLESMLADDQGRAQVFFRLGYEEGPNSHVVDAFLPGRRAESQSTFVASGFAVRVGSTTALRGVVLDNTNAPVPEVRISLRGSSLETASKANGTFLLQGVPSGPGLVDFEGAATSRPGSWPHLEFPVNLVEGRVNELAGPVYLVQLEEEVGLVVSETEGGTLENSDLPGFALEVAPGSALFSNGSRSGRVSATVVHSDRVPMPPVLGLEPRMVLTIQPAGTLFDPPARLRLPNTEGLRPGEVTEIFSFDHDAQRFVSIGTARASEDGAVLESEPGFGIVKAGWHWPCGNGVTGRGTAHNCPTCLKCTGSICQGSSEVSGNPCDDGDPCSFRDQCDSNGNCAGATQFFKEIEIKVNGREGLVVDGVGKEFHFTETHELTEGSCNVEHTWHFGEGTTSNEDAPVHTYTGPGIYDVKLELSCAECNLTGQRWTKVVAAAVSIKSEVARKDDPRNMDWATLQSALPIFGGEGTGDWARFTAQISPSLGRRLVESYVWAAEGPESQSGPDTKDWIIEGEGVNWTAGSYEMNLKVTFEGGGSTETMQEREVGVRTPEYFMVGAIIDEAPNPAAGVEPDLVDAMECPEAIFHLLVKLALGRSFNDPVGSHPLAIPEEVEDRLWFNRRGINLTLNADPAPLVDPNLPLEFRFGLYDFIHFRAFSRFQYRYTVEGDRINSEAQVVLENAVEAGLTPTPCFPAPHDLIPIISTRGELFPTSGEAGVSDDQTELRVSSIFRVGKLGQKDFIDLNRRIIPWVFFRFRLRILDGSLVSSFDPPASSNPDYPDNSDYSFLPSVYVFRRFYDPSLDVFRAELLGSAREDLESFLTIGHIVGEPSYP